MVDFYGEGRLTALYCTTCRVICFTSCAVHVPNKHHKSRLEALVSFCGSLPIFEGRTVSTSPEHLA